jgi:hypothetical protein
MLPNTAMLTTTITMAAPSMRRKRREGDRQAHAATHSRPAGARIEATKNAATHAMNRGKAMDHPSMMTAETGTAWVIV